MARAEDAEAPVVAEPLPNAATGCTTPVSVDIPG